MSIIEIKNVFKIFGTNTEKALKLVGENNSKEDILEKTGCTVAVNDVSLSIKKGEIFVVMGLSGSGKSTLIRCINRLIKPTKGELLIDGDNIVTMDKESLLKLRRTKMSMVFQHFGLFAHRSVLENVEYGLEVAGIEKEIRVEKAEAAIELVGLKGYENSYPSELSGGMQQRVGLARALANEPEILLMDEAFSALDPLIRAQMQDELLELQTKMKKTIVFITHDLDEALKLGDRIVILGQGGVVRQIGTPEEILTNPADDYVASFIQSVDAAKVIPASAVMKKPQTIVVPKDGIKMAHRKLEQAGLSTLFVTDSDRILKGVVKVDDVVKSVKQNKNNLDEIIDDNVSITQPDTPIADLFATAVTNKYPIAVVDEYHKLLGILTRGTVIAEVKSDYEEVLLSDAEPEPLENRPEKVEEVSNG